MRPQHIEILDLQRSTARMEIIVDLSIVVKEVGFPFSDVFSRKIMNL